jgi:predicted RNA-binding Zn-ribbon protein involved in translation (DUF1610 family)
LKILHLDIETAPNLAYVWGLWDQNVGIEQIAERDYILCWAAKWNGVGGTSYDYSRFYSGKKQMLIKMWELLDEADAVVHYNGKRFDIPWLNREFLQIGLTPPSPYKQIDLVETCKKQFRFPSNKLDYVSKELGLGKKIKTDFSLWLGCMRDETESWDKMIEYNINDTLLLEKLYNYLLPWIKNHANHNLYNDGSELLCPNCGGNHLQKRGFTQTLASVYQRYKCIDCGHWSKDNKILNRKQHKATSIQ